MPQITEAAVLQALEPLGTTVESVAQALIARGVQGFHNEPNSCPIANYLSATLGGYWDTYHTMYAGLRRDFMMDTPAHIIAFMDAFDSGQFPELDADTDKEEDV